ncbi:unnamed protein product [Lymnaea stagnalis]|uniref:Protein sleepless n=1 Tax=Lymnaea stagnalis TaxID=6523 RepID=A0AAV2I7I9_LYMST
MNKLVVAVVTLVAAFLVLEQSFAIKCFVCNSYHQADCADWFDNVTQHLVTCDSWQHKCRKIVQEVWLDDHWDIRYLRQCAAGGTIGKYEGRECQEVYGTYNIRVRYCHCDNQDGCNSAPRQTTQISAVLPVLLTLVVFVMRQIR